MVEAEHQKSTEEVAAENKAAAEASESQSQAEEQHEEETNVVINNHDLIGVEGILKNQKYEIDKKKL